MYISKHRDKHNFRVKMAFSLSISTLNLDHLYAYRKKLVYRVIQNFATSSWTKTGKAVAKPTIAPCNTTKSKWITQISAFETC